MITAALLSCHAQGIGLTIGWGLLVVSLMFLVEAHRRDYREHRREMDERRVRINEMEAETERLKVENRAKELTLREEKLCDD